MAHKFFASGFFISIVFFSSQIFADTYTWTAGSDGSFEELSNWALSSTEQAPEVLPTSSDDVVLPTGSYIVTVGEAFDIGSLVVNSGVTLNFSNGITTNKVSGKVTVKSGGVLTHALNDKKDDTKKLLLKANSMEIESGGKVSADCMGAFYPGCALQPSYGGVGGIGIGGTPIDTFGSIREPTDIGGNAGGTDNNDYRAGGAIYLEIENELLVNGTISALSQSGGNYYNGSGGSIYLKTGVLTGNGSIDASAGANTSTAGGGGGRIAIYESLNSMHGAFEGKIKAYGGFWGSNHTGCGTIYLESADDIPGQGTLIIDNGSQTIPQNTNASALMCSMVVDAQDTFGTVIIKNNAYLRIKDGITFKIKKDLIAESGGKIICDAGSVVEFVGSGESKILGANEFYSLRCIEPGKRLIFGSGAANKTTIKSGGSIVFKGLKESHISLVSQTEDSQWLLSIGANVVQDITFTDVKDSNATSGLLATSMDGLDLGNNTGWSIEKTPEPGELLTWIGVANTDWTNKENWDIGRVPVETDRVLIKSGCLHYPVISSAVTQNSITNELGAQITLKGANLTVTNDFANLGTISVNAADRLIFSGDGVQNVVLNDSKYNRITISKKGGGINFKDGFAVSFLRCKTEFPLVFKFKEGSTYEFDVVSFNGISERDASSRLITFESLLPGATWNLKLTEYNHLRGINISDCNASEGSKAIVGDFSTDLSGNTNIDFSEGAAAEWIGGNGSLNTAANWLSGVLPSSSAQVIISPPEGATWTPTANTAFQCGELILGCGGGTSKVKFSNKLTVVNSVRLNERTTLTLDYFSSSNEVGLDVELKNGAVLTHSAQSAGSEQYKLNLRIGRDVIVDAKSAINTEGKGFAANKGTFSGATVSGAGHASNAGNNKSSEITNKNTYGSLLNPFSLGSGASKAGGGAVKIIALGNIINNGTISAKGETTAYATGAGGSIWLSAKDISGTGKIVADMGDTTSGSAYKISSGGRIALYKTESIGWENFGISVSYKGGGSGTYYREDATGKGEIFIDQSLKSYITTPFPARGDSNALFNHKKAYRNMDLTVGTGTKLSLVAGSLGLGGMVVINDLILTGANNIICTDRTIKVMSKEHYKGRNWAGDNYEKRVSSGSIQIGSTGEIIWPVGFSLTIR